MKKFLTKSKRTSKEKEKQQKEREDDFLYGRSKPGGRGSKEHPDLSASENNGAHGSGDRVRRSGRHRNAPRTAQSAIVYASEPMTGGGMDGAAGRMGSRSGSASHLEEADRRYDGARGGGRDRGFGGGPGVAAGGGGLGSLAEHGEEVSSSAIHARKPPPTYAPKPAPPPPAAAGGGGKTSGMTQEEKDKLTKQRLKNERKKQSRFTASIKSAGTRKAPFDDRSQQSLLQRGSSFGSSFEDDGSRGSRGREVAQDEFGPKPPPDAHGQRDEADDLEQRRRRHREQAENDRRMKERAREQTAAARALRGSATAGAGRRDSAEGDLEQRRRRHREQAENDRKMKERAREQTAAARALRGSATAGAGRRDDAEGEPEWRRRRQREQTEKDRKIKESVRREKDATAAAPDEPRRSSVDEDFEERRRRRLENAGRPRRNRHHVTIVEPEGKDAFEAGLQEAQGEMGTLAVEPGGRHDAEPEVDMSQNVIDMHIAQLRATSKIATPDDEEYDTFEVDPNAGLHEFEQRAAAANASRRASRRISTTTLKINAWHEKYTWRKAIMLAERTPEMEWLGSFYRCDPRWQIMKFFNEVARDGGEASADENLGLDILANLFNKASVFTVWRPTSDEAIKNMMLGIATGKGLDIKGKSAKKGNISSYVPFVQIYEDAHKEHVRTFIKDGKTVRVFYQTDKARYEALEMITDIKDFMLFAAQDAMRVLSDDYADPEEQELAMKHLMYDDVSLNVQFVDTYVDSTTPVFGLDITERLFWEAYVMMQFCERPPGTEWDIGRKSVPAFMEMNFKSLRHEPDPGAPRAVVYQMSSDSPMDPRTLLLAYEENGRVKPVVSDFDCFLLGSRGVKYKNPIPDDQIELVKWSVNNISDVLDERAKTQSDDAWTDEWFKVLKKAALKGYYPKTPPYGNGDPKSYEIVQCAVSRLQSTGCVRHGAECFNWYFPQEIDEDFLVISDTLPGNLKWKKVKVPELQEILIQKIDEGFTFPINPKWVLCDPGWRRVYNKLLASRKPNVQDSINCWLPPGTGLREKIDAISARHPSGFGGSGSKVKFYRKDRLLMEDELERYVKMQRAWRKLRLVLYWIRFVREKRREREEREAAAREREFNRWHSDIDADE